jgi:hypothetical protein
VGSGAQRRPVVLAEWHPSSKLSALCGWQPMQDQPRWLRELADPSSMCRQRWRSDRTVGAREDA